MVYVKLKTSLRIFTLVVLVFVLFCRQIGTDYTPLPGSSFEKILIGKHTWHTGIILKKGLSTEHIDFFQESYPGAEFIEVGWGDFDFFRSEKATVGMAVKAMLWPTRSVLHVLPYYRDPSDYFPEGDIIEIELPQQGFKELVSYINTSFARDEYGKIIPLDSEINVRGQFYLSIEKYHLFKTCNVWTAKALKSGGYSVVPFYALSSGNLMKQIRRP